MLQKCCRGLLISTTNLLALWSCLFWAQEQSYEEMSLWAFQQRGRKEIEVALDLLVTWEILRFLHTFSLLFPRLSSASSFVTLVGFDFILMWYLDKSYSIFILFVLVVVPVSCSSEAGVVLLHFCSVNVVLKGCHIYVVTSAKHYKSWIISIVKFHYI